MKKWYPSLAAAGLSAVMLGVVYVYVLAPLAHPGRARVDVVETAPVSPRLPVANRADTADDAKQISELAIKKQLPLPVYQIEKIGGDVRDADRRFVGVWMSETGWLGSFRQMMLIVTSVDADGMADGYAANAPPNQRATFRSPPRYWPLECGFPETPSPLVTTQANSRERLRRKTRWHLK